MVHDTTVKLNCYDGFSVETKTKVLTIIIKPNECRAEIVQRTNINSYNLKLRIETYLICAHLFHYYYELTNH